MEARFIENPSHQYMSVSESHLRLNQQSQPNLHLTHNHPIEDTLDGDLSEKIETNFQQVAKNIDEASRVVFPIAFSVFMFFYWFYYLYT